MDIKIKYELLSNHLNEKVRRLVLGAEAIALGRGGISEVSRQTGVCRESIALGISELKTIPEIPNDKERIRKEGGGRKKTTDTDLTLKSTLEKLIVSSTMGDPESLLLWTSKSLRNLADELKALGHKTSHRMVGVLLHEMGYSLQANRKTNEGGKHPDRNAQFEYIDNKAMEFTIENNPVISVDAKKKELVGEYKNNGKEWAKKGQPIEVNVYDFIGEQGKVCPYGVYDINKNKGWVNVGTDHDTAEFAVESIRKWWNLIGKFTYPNSNKLLINADGGGSNGSRVRLWKLELQRFATESNLEITVLHFPPGTSKWNKIEHQLFSYISINWRGKPLVSHEVIVSLISSTKTSKGLTVECGLDKNKYAVGTKVTDEQVNC